MAVACSSPVQKKEDAAAKAAKHYYEQLIAGDYDAYVKGLNMPAKVPDSYKSQILANAKMFIDQQNKERAGIKEVSVANSTCDTLHHVANVFLLLSYGDKTSEQVVVPMVERKGEWLMR